MRVLLLIVLLALPAWAGPQGYFDDANHPPRVSTPGRGYVFQPAATTATKTATVLPAQVPAPTVTVPSFNPTPTFPSSVPSTVTAPSMNAMPAYPSSVPPILTAPQDLPPGVTTPGRPVPSGPPGY